MVSTLAVLLASCKGSSGGEDEGVVEETPEEVVETTPAGDQTPDGSGGKSAESSSAGLSAALAAALKGITAEQKAAEPPPDLDRDAGRKSYETSCSSCHGSTGAGDGSAAKYLSPGPGDWTSPERFQVTTRGEKVWIILNGVGGSSAMPPFKAAMSDKQAWEVVAHMDSFKTGPSGDAGPAPEAQ